MTLISRSFGQERKPQELDISVISALKETKTINKMERFNGEVRDREKIMRGLKKKDTPTLKGYQTFHNYIRPHEGLNGKIPAEACGIEVEGTNKWLTLI